jgi:hypothetical protein
MAFQPHQREKMTLICPVILNTMMNMKARIFAQKTMIAL